MMIFSLVAMTGLEKCCITSAYVQWLCHSGERLVSRGPLVFLFILPVQTNRKSFVFPLVLLFMSTHLVKCHKKILYTDFLDKVINAKSADPDQNAPQKEESDKDLHCLPFNAVFWETNAFEAKFNKRNGIRDGPFEFLGCVCWGRMEEMGGFFSQNYFSLTK